MIAIMAGRSWKFFAAVGMAAAVAMMVSLVVPAVWRRPGAAAVNRSAAFDVSPLGSLCDTGSDTGAAAEQEETDCQESGSGCGTSQAGPRPDPPPVPPPPVVPAAAAVEQKSQGERPAAKLLVSFDGLGVGFEGPQGAATGRNPSDNSLAVGPNHIVEIVNSRLAVFDKKGKVLYGAVATNTIFKGFGGICEARNNGDSVVRYDQLAGRWLYVMPIFGRIPDRPAEPYSMCYAVSAGADPLGPYYRYEFRRKLFPDYPRPAVWPDGYYVPSSTGDDVIQKHACVADREKMLRGAEATEQCVVIDGVNFLNNADIDGQELPPAGAPNIIMAAGGTQLNKEFEDDGIYAYQFHVDFKTPVNTKVSGPVKIPVAPYHYLCNGQLTSCVPQPDTTRRLDAQGDKLMQRLVYRRRGGVESIVALHSVNTAAGGGGVRWYEFRLAGGAPGSERAVRLYQQGTYAPDAFYRWMGSIGMDRQGNIAMGYSFGGAPNFAGQRFAGRLDGDPPGALTLHETILAEGEASQTNTLRWEDYATTAMDPADDCTFWYVGDYLKKGAASYSSRIGAFRLPGCLRATVSGASYLDLNHNGRRDPGEPGFAGREVAYAGPQTGRLTTGADGQFSISLAADPAYADPVYTFTAAGATNTVRLSAGTEAAVEFASVCTVRNTGAYGPSFWEGPKGAALLEAHDAEWRTLLNSTLQLVNADGSRLAIAGAGQPASAQLRLWLRKASARNAAYMLSAQLAVAALNVALGGQGGNATVADPVAGDWLAIRALIARVSARLAGPADAQAIAAYEKLLDGLNRNTAMVTPPKAAGCGWQ